MKKILGLDLGTTSIGWAYVNEANEENEQSSIKRLGVRVIPISTDEETDFQKGKSITINADRTLKRGARRTLDRYQLRRDNLIEILKTYNFINNTTFLSENGKDSTFSTCQIRAKAATEKISKEEIARTLLAINKKRGYKSSRKVTNEDEGQVIDEMEVAKKLYELNLTPGQYVYKILKEGKKFVPDFYRSDLQEEFNRIWKYQKQYYHNVLVDELKEELKNKNKTQTWAICQKPFGIVGVKRIGKANEKKIENYQWRADGLSKQLDLEQLAIVLQEINNQLKSSSGYLGAISDRSKELYFSKQTVGEYLYSQLKQKPHSRLKNQVFYRQDYLDEFEKIWEVQKKYYPELTNELKTEIRDVVIFFQRKLKSQKHLISECEFEKYHKVIPKSSPLFQENKIWLILNNLELFDKRTRTKIKNGEIDIENKQLLFEELNIRNSLTAKQVLEILVDNPKDFELNYKEVEGNRTNTILYNAYHHIVKLSESKEYDFNKMPASEINYLVNTVFAQEGINPSILSFDATLEGNTFDKQPLYQLWHLLYSYEGDKSATGNISLLEKLSKKFGFKNEFARIISNVILQDDYGNLSAKAIRKILPHLMEGNTYDVACTLAGYNHSHSLTKEEKEKRKLNDKLDLLKKNSLRNPVVEKILNQMVNVINAIIDDKTLGKPDEVRIELARELKKSANERKEMTDNINKATRVHQEIRKILQNEFGISKVTRNDIIRYKLYLELKSNGFKTIYTNTYIQKEKLFSKEFDIEHIIPQARLFDDSFSNKTLAVRSVNLNKGDKTAYDYLSEFLSEDDFQHYIKRIEKMYKDGEIKKAKYNKLLLQEKNIPDGFIDRDLRDSQYIAKKAKQMLEEVIRDVYTTTGKVTNRLREDWQLINVMKELNLPKYKALGLVDIVEGKNGQPEERIRDWTKRNDHRHHTMDALTVAFTKPSYVQYLNNLNARSDKGSSIYGIEQKELYRNGNGKLLFKSPLPLNDFRTEAKTKLENVLVSFKAKNKVVTKNKNRIKQKGKEHFKTQTVLTPRGQLHKETVYGKIQQYVTNEEKVGTKFDYEKISRIAKKSYREALIKRLNEFEGDPKKAFGGKNSPAKNPIYLDEEKTLPLPEKVKLVWKEDNYTIRKDISPDLKIDKVIDVGIRELLSKRLADFDNDAKKAFSNLDENPIWLNEEKGISIKRVTISGVNNVEAIHYKKDHNGKYILDESGKKQPVDFVSTGNNHHVAIYRDEKGNLQEEVISFYEAVHRVNAGLPIINKNHEKGWEFLFSMKQNEYFVFPLDDFDPGEIDLMNPDNNIIISPNLYRVQKIAERNYMFRHHLETTVDDNTVLKNVTYINLRNTNAVKRIIKVRINHLGSIVKVGEY